MMLQLMVVSFLAHVTHGNQHASMFSSEELQFFASLQLCKHFGGLCGFSCPFRYIRHRWNIPLCPTDMECCIGPPLELDSNTRAAHSETPTTTVSSLLTTVTTTATSTTETTSATTATTTTTTTTTTPATTAAAAAEAATRNRHPIRQQFQAAGPSSNSCGAAPSGDPARRKRIVGGNLATPGSWPWLVALRSMLGSHACSGALVAQRWIVTAAHCFKHISNPSLWRVRIGEYDLLQHDHGERDVHIDAIIVNPGYRTQRGEDAENQTLYTQYVNDIALVHLREEVGAEPICLPTNEESPTAAAADDDNDAYAQCWVAGWGVTMDQMNEDQRLRQVSGPVIPNDVCGDLWGSPLRDSMMCFGDGTYGPCAGDSGGPLSCQDFGGRYTLEGVVSWGTEDCNLSGYPAVFTRLRPYLSWIRQHVEETASTA